jgi:hypothetical protein
VKTEDTSGCNSELQSVEIAIALQLPVVPSGLYKVSINLII